METIDATYRAVTPMFLGGADDQRAEFRLSSFEEALRFWWRALAWRRLGGDLERIYREEQTLFGDAASESEPVVGRGMVAMKAAYDELGEIPADTVLKTRGWRGAPLGDGVLYLGRGVMETDTTDDRSKVAGRLTRACLEPGVEFTIRLLLWSALETTHREQLERALRTLGLFGGLGRNSRRGWGSLQLVELNGDPVDGTLEGVASACESCLAGAQPESPAPWPVHTAFHDGASGRLVVGSPDQAPLDLLDEVAEELVWYRSNGRDDAGTRTVLGKEVDPEERPFWNDRTLVAAAARGELSPEEHPDRIVFGLPDEYVVSSTGDEVSIEGTEHRRRRSPLFFHLHELEDGRPAVVVLLLPARFLPEDEDVDVVGTEVPLDRSEAFWAPIHTFLERLDAPRYRPSSFPEVRELSP